MSKTTTKQTSDWWNEETDCVAGFVFSDRRTFFYMRDIMGEGRNLLEKSRLLHDYMEAFPPTIEWEEDYTAKQRRAAMNQVNWYELAAYIMEYDWFADITD